MQGTRTLHVDLESFFLETVFSCRFLKRREELYEQKPSQGLWCQGGDIGHQALHDGLYDTWPNVSKPRESCEAPNAKMTRRLTVARGTEVLLMGKLHEKVLPEDSREMPGVESALPHTSIRAVYTLVTCLCQYNIVSYTLYTYLQSHAVSHRDTQTHPNRRAHGFTFTSECHWQSLARSLFGTWKMSIKPHDLNSSGSVATRALTQDFQVIISLQKSRESWWKCVLEGDPDRDALRKYPGYRFTSRF